jgi:outer membrane protein, heavy metal efflux system
MNSISFRRGGFVLLLCIHLHAALQAQDTLAINLQKAEQQFLEKNLQLLASKYDVDIAKAQVMQARLFNNPSVQVSTALYNQNDHKLLDVSNATGQYGINVQQLITLAGKRNKQIKLAEINATQSDNTLLELLRTLRFTLRSDFYNAYFLRGSINAFTQQINTLKQLDSTYAAFLAKGLVTLKDVVRIRSLLYSLQAEQTDLQNQLRDVQSELQLLLQDNKTFFIPEVNDAHLAFVSPQLNLQQLLDTASANRYDLKSANTAVAYNQQNLALQKALRVPDLTLGAEFDKRGSYINNATFLNAAIDLPFFNRNQGNIKAAKASVDQSKALYTQQQAIVENDVQKAYGKMLNTQKMLQSFDPGFNSQYEQLMKGVAENFGKRNLSLIDFADFVESYRNNVLQFNQLQNDRRQAIESLNFAVGKLIIE